MSSITERPVGFRLALVHPERIIAVISQNGNAYEEGLSQGWNPIQKYWKQPTPANRDALRQFLKPEATKAQYLYGVSDTTLVAPECYELDTALLARPGIDDIQLDLFLDYASNVALYLGFEVDYVIKDTLPLAPNTMATGRSPSTESRQSFGSCELFVPAPVVA